MNKKSKKSFKDSTAHLDRFFSETVETKETRDTLRTQKTQNTHKVQDPIEPPPTKYYRLNLKLKAEYREYLNRVSWESHKSITQYINDLIAADKATKNT